MASKIYRRIGAVVLAASIAGVAFAQYSYAPFFEQPRVQSQAYGLELVLQRLRVVDAFSAPLNEELLEQVEEMLEGDVYRFIGTLTARDPQLAHDLLGALAKVEDVVEDGEDATAAVAEARELVGRAYDVLIHSDIRSSPAFIGAVIADLSLGDGGVGEGYEDAAEDDDELWEFTSGWSALQRVAELWSEIAPIATMQQRADVQEMLDSLSELYPQAHPPEAVTGDPEEAEAPVQRMLSILEAVVDAELFAGRDMKALAGRLVDEMNPICAAYQAGSDAVALEGMFAVGELYSRNLRRFLGFMAPDVHDVAAGIIESLTDPEGEAADVLPAAACLELQEALEAAYEALGG